MLADGFLDKGVWVAFPVVVGVVGFTLWPDWLRPDTGSLRNVGQPNAGQTERAVGAVQPTRDDSISRALAATAAADPAHQGRGFRDCGVCPEMMVLPSGSYQMGSPLGEAGRYDNEGPVHTVRIGYVLAVGKYEVTFEEWDACVRAGGCGGHWPDDEGWGRGRRPVVNVSWRDAQGYASWLSRETGESYRLLSEAEWEYAARAGTRTARYWGESESGQCGYANGADATFLDANPGRPDVASCSDGYLNTAPVGTFGANGFGLNDMLGNVSEWTEDCYPGSYSGAPMDGRAWTGGSCRLRRIRGGGTDAGPRDLRSARRGSFFGSHRMSGVGFRVARTFD